MQQKLRPIAIYLPQYHPIPENDANWGKGFTEWTNVTRAKPRFRNHYQPHLPADLGFYDLRLEEARLAQEALAKEYGVYGFCYYHYWFNGKRVMNEPIDRKLKNPKEDLPFLFCWANENWTRAWDGSEREILLQQNYSEEDDRNHIRFLIPYFKDPRYIKVGKKPVFVIYKDALIPDIRQSIRTFREEAAKEGLELYLCRFDRQMGTVKGNPEELGFDAAIEFQPFSPALKSFIKASHKPNILPRFLRPSKYVEYIRHRILKNPHRKADIIVDYNQYVDYDKQYPLPGYKLYPGLCPGWDNSSRRARSHAQIFVNSTPAKFGEWAAFKFEQFKPFSAEENFIFINAWNEWAEGNHLEPCQKWGHQYLQALRKALFE